MLPSELSLIGVSHGQLDKCSGLYVDNPGWENLKPFWWQLKNDETGELEDVCCGGDGLCAATCSDLGTMQTDPSALGAAEKQP